MVVAAVPVVTVGGMFVDAVIMVRMRGLRVARGWSLDNLAPRCGLSPSTLSRIETGQRRIALDQLVPICRAFGTTLDELVEADGDADVVIRPQPGYSPGQTTWVLSDGDGIHGKTVAKMRKAPDMSGGGRRLGVHPGEVAEFSTMVPHAICAHDGPVEILTILNHEGGRAHLHGTHGIDQVPYQPVCKDGCMKPNNVRAWSLAALLAASAVNHLANPKFYYPVVPAVLCTDKEGALGVMTRRQWVLASAAPEALAAAGLLIPGTRKLAATATTVMFIGFTFGHLTALRHAFGPNGSTEQRRIHAVRLPLQIPLVAWAWKSRA